MPFQKGNTIWKESVKARVENNSRLSEFFSILASGGITKYADFLDKLSRKEELSKEEKEFMDRVERLFPYIKARKTDVTSDGKELNQILVKFIKDDD